MCEAAQEREDRLHVFQTGNHPGQQHRSTNVFGNDQNHRVSGTCKEVEEQVQVQVSNSDCDVSKCNTSKIQANNSVAYIEQATKSIIDKVLPMVLKAAMEGVQEDLGQIVKTIVTEPISDLAHRLHDLEELCIRLSSKIKFLEEKCLVNESSQVLGNQRVSSRPMNSEECSRSVKKQVSLVAEVPCTTSDEKLNQYRRGVQSPMTSKPSVQVYQ